MGRAKRLRRGAVELGRRIRSRRIELGLSQMALAFKVGLDATYISDVERGTRNLGVENLLRLAEALDLDPACLVHRSWA
jgi:transcriptional regulator with XRE-family HTH domain